MYINKWSTYQRNKGYLWLKLIIKLEWKWSIKWVALINKAINWVKVGRNISKIRCKKIDWAIIKVNGITNF